MDSANTCSPPLDLPRPFMGVFSQKTSKRVGFGATSKKRQLLKYWFVEVDGKGAASIQPVNKNLIPVGDKKTISHEKLLKDYVPEPDMYVSQVLPAMRELEKTVDQGDGHRDKGELFSAEHSYSMALDIDEEHVRANFGIGLVFLDMGDKKKARDVFLKLVAMKAPFREEHKHLFNEFGIKLRKNGMFREALEYYSRARDLCGNDDHILFNISRAHFELNDAETAHDFVGKCLKLNPALSAAKKLRSRLRRTNPGLKAGQQALNIGEF